MQARAWSLRLAREGDVLVVKAVGKYTPKAHEHVRSLVEAAVEESPAKAVVLDLSDTAAIAHPGESQRLVIETSTYSGDPLGLPVAVVVPSPRFSGLVTLCAEMWTHGHVWAPFVEIEDALDWASRRPPLWRHYSSR
jgi:hypothetical protein